MALSWDGLQAGGAEDDEQSALKANFAAGGVVPFVERMGATAEAAGTNGDGRDTKRERDVRVSRRALEAGAISYHAVGFADSGEQGRIFGELAAGTDAESAELDVELDVCAVAT